MADTATETDIFMQQKKTIDTLIDVLEKQGQSSGTQTVYAQPIEQKTEQPPNYLLYGAIGLVIFLLLKRK